MRWNLWLAAILVAGLAASGRAQDLSPFPAAGLAPPPVVDEVPASGLAYPSGIEPPAIDFGVTAGTRQPMDDAAGTIMRPGPVVIEPRWSADIGLLVLNRADTGDMGLSLVVGADELDHGAAAAVLLDIEYHLTDRWRIEARSFGPMRMTSEKDRYYRFRSQSDLTSSEFNFRRQVGPIFSWLVGLRAIELDDAFARIDTGEHSVFEMHTDNRLFGLQIGADLTLWADARPFRIDTMARAGVYHNSIDRYHAWYFDSHEESAASFAGELGVVGVWEVRDWLEVRGGYQMLLLTGMALATEQVDGLDSDDSVLYHGPMFAVRLLW